ncbi:MAG: PD-(D/E)XK nuclease family protein, partial [Pseudoflavonifractor sp.]
MLQLLLGRSGTGKTAAILQAIAASDGLRPQVLIVPEQHSHEMERRLCAIGGNRVSQYAEVLSFTRLAGRVASVTGGIAAPTLDAGGRLLLMYTALQTVASQLKVYGKPSKKPEFLAGMIATVDELKSCCITSAHLWQAGEDADGAEGDKLLDLSLIYGAYEALTARQGADPRDRITRLARGLVESRWAAGMDIYLDGFTDFTPQELQVLRCLMAQANKVTLALTCDRLEETENGTGVFSPARRTAQHLLAIAREESITPEVVLRTQPVRDRAPELAALEQQLFEPKPATWTQAAPALHLRRANTPYAEVEQVAASILHLVRERGYRFRDIAVTARSMTGYGDLIETIFARYEIPVFLTGMTDILQKPVLALITAALDTVAGNYQYDDLFRYLKTGLTDLTAADCDLLENYALTWDLRGKKWTQKEDWTMHPRGYGLPLNPQDETSLRHLNEVRRAVIAPLEALRKNSIHTGRGQVIALYSFLEEIHLPHRLLDRTEQLQKRGEAALAEEYRQLWDILCDSMEQCAQILGDAALEREEFARLFQLVLSQYDVGSIPVSLDRVMAGEMPRLAHKSCKVLFLVGADDGQIPAAAPSPGLLNDDDRSLLASYGLELAPSLTEKLYREMTIVYETCALPDALLCLSWAAVDSGGEEHRPAFFLSKLRGMFPGLKLETETSRRDAPRLAAPRPALELAGRSQQVAEALSALPEYAPLVERMQQAQGLERGSLARATVDALYGARVPMSASRMDRYKSCQFSYFMQYGLKALPRKPAGFSAPEYGTFIHYVLEHVLQNPAYQNAEPSALRQMTKAAVDQYVAEELGGLENETPRFQYLFRRLLKSVNAVVENVTEELACSDFRPIAFELGFGEKSDLPPVELTQDGITLSISGFVDRVDGWQHDGKLYLRVVDYKTGRKSFDLTDVWNGLGLQMLLYLFTLEKEGASRLGCKELVPAGVLYLPARNTVISGSRGMTEEAQRKEVDKELRRRGLVLDDPAVLAAMEHYGSEGIRFLPLTLSSKTKEITGDALVSAERLGKLETHIKRILGEIGKDMAAGKIAADPFWKGQEQNACTYCDYAAACQFEDGHGGDCRRWMPTVKAEEFWKGV